MVTTSPDLTPRIPGSRVSLLSKPSKMRIHWNGRLRRVYSWGLPAVVTCPGAQFGEDSACSFCYASPQSQKVQENGRTRKRVGTYGFAGVKAAQSARYAWTQECLITESGRQEWVTVMIAAVKWATRSVPYFRVHDSGDMFSASYTRMWAQVVAACSEVKFWIPTRSWNVEKPGLPPLRRAMLAQTAAALVELATLPNVAVRPSALHTDVPAPVIPGLHAGTGITTDHTPREGVCPAPTTDGNCADCRACWDNKDDTRMYVLH